ncbi:unnamed protein product [Chilo suppressalis]|uniref:Uncharacterized protein n=1 Tax=Chilo suppressalis TaxID=168631 RepID=A0ABN8BA90_CHISP|nr:unnamed protein product [Chilo suppressalis]
MRRTNRHLIIERGARDATWEEQSEYVSPNTLARIRVDVSVFRTGIQSSVNIASGNSSNFFRAPEYGITIKSPCVSAAALRPWWLRRRVRARGHRLLAAPVSVSSGPATTWRCDLETGLYHNPLPTSMAVEARESTWPSATCSPSARLQRRAREHGHRLSATPVSMLSASAKTWRCHLETEHVAIGYVLPRCVFRIARGQRDAAAWRLEREGTWSPAERDSGVYVECLGENMALRSGDRSVPQSLDNPDGCADARGYMVTRYVQPRCLCRVARLQHSAAIWRQFPSQNANRKLKETLSSAVFRASTALKTFCTSKAESKGIQKLVEVNGTCVVSSRSVEEVQRALGVGPARLVLLRPHAAAGPLGTAAAPQPPPTALTQLLRASEGTLSRWSRLHLQSLATTNPHWARVTEAASLRSELGALRTAAEEAERAKEGLRADNTRLTHRISYLEEQVAEMLARHTQLQPVSSTDSSCITVNKTKKNVTNINITSEPACRQSPKSEVQVFQKGPDITALVAKLPGLDGAEANLPLLRPRSNASGASSRAPPSPRASPPHHRHRAHSSHSLEHRAARMRHSLSHHCLHAADDYGAETDAAIRMIERNQRHIEKQRLKSERLGRSRTDDHFRSDSDLDARDSLSGVGPPEPRPADRIEESIKKTNWAERKTLSIIEQLKRSQRLRKSKKPDSAEDVRLETEKRYSYHRIDGKVLENAHKSSRRSSKLHSRSAKSSEFESECSDFPNGDAYGSSPRIDYGSESCSTRLSHYRKNENEARTRPTPPRKPLRLSLHKARSAHSLLNGSESETPSRPPSEAQNADGPDANKRPVKRTHAGDKWAREREREKEKERERGRENVRATPRPSRKLLQGLAPAADDLYPAPTRRSAPIVPPANWC